MGGPSEYPWYYRRVEASIEDGGGTCEVLLQVKPVIEEESLDAWLADNKGTPTAGEIATIAIDDPTPAQVELCEEQGIAVEWWIDAVREGLGRWSERGPFPSLDSARRHLDAWAEEPPVFVPERANQTPLG